MPKATLPNGDLKPIDDCYVFIPGYGIIDINVLPDISDSKSAAYNDEPIIGRSFPLKTYSHSENRAISFSITLISVKRTDFRKNLSILRALESAVYPRDEMSGMAVPFVPPPVCQIKCGRMLGDSPLCVILKNYNTKFPTDVPWNPEYNMPWKFNVDTSWEVVYRSSKLPGQARIISLGV